MIKPGCLCFAKVKGYAPWPARVNVLPKDVKIPRGKIPVFFYGTHQVSFVSENDIFDFEKHKEIYGAYKGKNNKFAEGMKELTSNPRVLQLGFDKMAINYLSQFYKFDSMSAETLPTESERESHTMAKSEDCIQMKKSEVTGAKVHQEDKCIHDCPRLKRLRIPDEEEDDRPFKLVKLTSEPNDFLESGSIDMAPKSVDSNQTDEQEEDQTVSEDAQVNLPQISYDEEERNSTSFKAFSSIESNVDIDSYPIDLTDISIEKIHINAHKGKIIDNMAEIMSFVPKLDLSHPFLKSTPCIILERLEIDINSIPKDFFVGTEKCNEEVGKQNCNTDINLSKYSGPSHNFPETFPTDHDHTVSNTISFKSPIEDIDTKRPKRASALRFQLRLQSFIKENSQRPHVVNNAKNTNISNKVKEERKVNHQISHNPKRSKEDVTCAERNHKMSQRPSIAVISEDERNLRIVSQLSVIDKEIKRSLIVGQENYEMCGKLMQKLSLLTNLSLTLLCKVPEIVTTMWKCRRYKKDDSIRSSASEMYQRFYQVYEQSDIDERIEGGTELLKRDRNNCKSAQTLMDELFIAETKNPSCRPPVAHLCLSSPGSAPSHQSSAANTPLLQIESESIVFLDPLIVDINELLSNGTLELIECYEADRDFGHPETAKPSFDSTQELYRQLGV